MGKKDPRVDAYIAKASDFAKPILKSLRETVHAACPDVEEDMKWSTPTFMYKGILCGMSAFKEHAAFGFWKAGLVLGKGPEMDSGAGQFGRLTNASDLPSKKVLTGYVRKAMALNDSGVAVARAARAAAKPVVVPDDLADALRKNKKARVVFDAFSPSHRREYVEWITEAKREETRTRRLQTAIPQIADGKPHLEVHEMNVRQVGPVGRVGRVGCGGRVGWVGRVGLPGRFRAVVVLSVVYFLCGGAVAAAQTCTGMPGRTGTIELKQGTMTRIFVVRVPASYDGRTPLPMVIAFHPGGMSAQYMQGRVPVHRVWPEAIAVFPEGFPNLGAGQASLRPTWQRAPGEMDNRDLAYFDQMIEWLRANHCFNAKQLFVMGYSNGAGFTGVLACERASLIAGVAIASGRLVCTPAEPKPAILSHGVADPTIPYDNGVGAAKGWASRNQCSAPPTSGAPGCFAAGPCASAPVTMCTFDGGHEYYEPFTKTFVDFFKRSMVQ